MLRRRGQILYTNDVNLVFVCLCEILTDTIVCMRECQQNNIDSGFHLN